MRESIKQGESMKIRLEIRVSKKGEYADRIAERSRDGVETISPLYTGKSLTMSSVSRLPKQSSDFTKCVGLVAIGRGSDEQNRSFIVHAVPTRNAEFILQYRAALQARLADFMAQVDPGSAQLGIFGGLRIAEEDPRFDNAAAMNQWYADTVGILGNTVIESIGKQPRTLHRPNGPDEHIDFFLDTADALMYIETYTK